MGNELRSSFFFFFLSFDFHCREKNCHRAVDDVRVGVCAKSALKDKFFFFASQFLSLGARLRPG